MTWLAVGFTVGLIALLASSARVVTSLARLAGALRLTAFAAGAIIMAFATTAPELLVGISSAIGGQPALSLGNAVGTLVTNLGLILGILLIQARVIRFETTVFRRDLLLVYLLGFLMLLLGFDGQLTRLDGGVLILGFILWFSHLMHERRFFHEIWNATIPLWGCFGAFASFLGAIAILILAAEITVRTGTALAVQLGIPAFLLGVIGIAVGTSLPELIFALRATAAKKSAFAVGDLISASAITATLVLGLTALITPITAIEPLPLLIAGFTYLLAAIVTISPLAFERSILRRSTGWTLILIWLTFIVGQSLLS